MMKIVAIALAFAVLFAAQVKLPQSSDAEACSYNCVVSPQPRPFRSVDALL
jgi:hypothetical protein